MKKIHTGIVLTTLLVVLLGNTVMARDTTKCLKGHTYSKTALENTIIKAGFPKDSFTVQWVSCEEDGLKLSCHGVTTVARPMTITGPSGDSYLVQPGERLVFMGHKLDPIK